MTLKNKDTNELVRLCVSITMWNLGVLLTLAMAGGAALWRISTDVKIMKSAMQQTDNASAPASGPRWGAETAEAREAPDSTATRRQTWKPSE